MVKLKNSERRMIESMFVSDPGYILDFSNTTFKEFFEDEIGIDIYDDAYAGLGNSKANRFRKFLEVSSPRAAGKILRALWSIKVDEQQSTLDSEVDHLMLRGYKPDNLDAYRANELESLEQEQQKFFDLVSEIEQRDESEAVKHVLELARTFDLDTVLDEIERARSFIDDDPEDAITAASSLLESVFRSILVELKLELPKDRSIHPLYKSVREPLKLAADEKSDDGVRKTLAALGNVVDGIGTLRTQAGDAHGREKGVKRADARIARLAVNSASSLAVFLIETWQRHYPSRELPNIDVSKE